MSTTDTSSGLTDRAVRAANELSSRWALSLGGVTPGDRGTAFSGIGVWPLLGLLGAGAGEPGRTELAKAFGLDPSEASATVRAVVALFDTSPGLSMAMGLWRQRSLTVRDSWLELLPPATRGVLSGDVRADQTALDEWVIEHTDGRIRRMPCDLSAGIQLVLASALTVDTEWSSPFKEVPDMTGTGNWSGRRLTRLDRQADAEESRLTQTPAGPLTITVQRGTGEVDVYLLLGAEDRSSSEVLGHGLRALDSLDEAVPSNRWAGDRPAPGVTITQTTTPGGKPVTRLECVPFDLSAQHDLLAAAEVFGLKQSSAPGDRFPGISETPLSLDQARQDVVAEFSKDGFKAAAVTSVGLRRAAFAQPPQLLPATLTTISFTRPFGFAAVHRDSGLVLVAGWVAEP